MNSTLWNSQEEVVLSFVLAPATISIYGYAIFLNYALYDYQDEKPKEEKSPIDVLIKDIKNVEFWGLYLTFLITFISLFTPPINSDLIYIVSHVMIFLVNFYSVSWLVTLYIQYVYTFQHEKFLSTNIVSLRWKSLAWKLILTILSLLLNIAFPAPKFMIPLYFKMLSKGDHYER